MWYWQVIAWLIVLAAMLWLIGETIGTLRSWWRR